MPAHVSIHHEPRDYGERREKWIEGELDELIKCEVICRTDKVRCAANLVLVEGQ